MKLEHAAVHGIEKVEGKTEHGKEKVKSGKEKVKTKIKGKIGADGEEIELTTPPPETTPAAEPPQKEAVPEDPYLKEPLSPWRKARDDEEYES